ncbi:MAG: squalene cyclase [Kiritimatiellia bacterium]|jgi:squalene cyclase
MRRGLTLLLALLLLSGLPGYGQDLFRYHGDPIPANIESLYVKGLNYLQKSQTNAGGWPDSYGSQPGVIGLAVLAMLAHGEDPNFGPYARTIRLGLDNILKQCNATTGYIGSSMYNHGFATLALAEAYGTVNDPRIGPALKRAVDLILSSQARNNFGAWRYSPESNDADTTVSGAQMVALFAASNAGLPIPDKAIKTGLNYYRTTQSEDGGFGYSSAGGSNGPRSAIGALVFALGKQKDTREFKAAFKYIEQVGFQESSYPYYYLYYASQAFFHGDMKVFEKWNIENARWLGGTQNTDGSWMGSHGQTFSTASALLSLAVNYRLVPIYER